MIKVISIILILLLTPLVSMGQSVKWSLDECIEYALTNNIQIEQSKLLHELDKESLQQAKDARLPIVMGTVREDYFFGNGVDNFIEGANGGVLSTGLSLATTVPIFTGLKIVNEINASEWKKKASNENINYAKLSVKIRVATAYLQVLYCKSHMQLAESQVETDKVLIERARALVEEGTRPRSEIAQAEAQLSNDEYNLTQAQSALKLALISMAHLINYSDVDNFDVISFDEGMSLPLFNYSLDELRNQIVDNHPAVKSALYQMESFKYRTKVAKSYYYPQIGLYGNLGNAFLAPFGSNVVEFDPKKYTNLVGVVGISITIPIFSANSVKHAVNKSKMNERISSITLHESKLQIEKEVRDAYYAALTSLDNHRSALKARDANETAYNFEQELYSSGRSTLYDLIEIRQKWLMSEENALQAMYEYMMRVNILDFYTKH